jgi:hypothetical protein
VYGFCCHANVVCRAPAITKIDVAPVSATAYVGAICIAFAWCLTVLVQLDATIMISLSSSAQYVEARQS